MKLDYAFDFFEYVINPEMKPLYIKSVMASLNGLMCVILLSHEKLRNYLVVPHWWLSSDTPPKNPSFQCQHSPTAGLKRWLYKVCSLLLDKEQQLPSA